MWSGSTTATTKAEAKLVKALDYLVAINDNSDNPAQKWVINESILASLTGCFRLRGAVVSGARYERAIIWPKSTIEQGLRVLRAELIEIAATRLMLNRLAQA